MCFVDCSFVTDAVLPSCLPDLILGLFLGIFYICYSKRAQFTLEYIIILYVESLYGHLITLAALQPLICARLYFVFLY